MTAAPRIVVLISGRGSNLGALLDAARTGELGGEIVAVISNRPDARGLSLAAQHGVATTIIDHRAYADRAGFESALRAAIDAHAPDLVVLAGFMRSLGALFVDHYRGRMLNIHPSLLPAFPGLHTHRRALAAGVRIHGCTVHFVNTEVDHGPIVAQSALLVRPDDDEVSLAARVLALEHRLLPRVVRAFCEGRVVIAGERATVKDALVGNDLLESPGPAS
jgi:phosphoribosylglycinamide formyltransferase-1